MVSSDRTAEVKNSYLTKILEELVQIPSPSGFTSDVTSFIVAELQHWGYKPWQSRKGSCVVSLGGDGSPLVLNAHVDTLGAMVKSLKVTGRVEFTCIGRFTMFSVEGENCRVHTQTGETFTGTIQSTSPSVHVFDDAATKERSLKNMEIRLDEVVKSKEDLQSLGVEPGNFVSIDPRFMLTPSGFVKSRHLDDKAGVAVLLDLARRLREENLALERKVYLFFSIYEEVGHGASSGIPEDAEEVISVDMGAVGDTLETSEYVVSICAKDSGGPYDARVVRALADTAKKHSIDYSVDIYPFYGSDAGASLRAGYDVRFGLIGPGVEASHAYERTHVYALSNTSDLLVHYASG